VVQTSDSASFFVKCCKLSAQLYSFVLYCGWGMCYIVFVAKIKRENIMTIEQKKELGVVVSIVAVISLIVLVSLINKFNIYDFFYLIVCIVFLFRYIRVRTKK